MTPISDEGTTFRGLSMTPMLRWPRGLWIAGAIMAVVGAAWFLGDLNHGNASFLFGVPLGAVGIAICASALSSGRSALVAMLLNVSAGAILTVAGLFQWAGAGLGLAWEPHNSSLQCATGVGLLLVAAGIAWSVYGLRKIT
jgi:hypothetical protein